MEQNPFWEIVIRSVGQEIPHLYKHKDSLQQPTTAPCPESTEYSPQFHTLFLYDLFSYSPTIYMYVS
jgi:hypothetical protein